MKTGIEQALSAPFPNEQISWRAQSLTKDGTKAMALAYIDARDVMERLDSVVGAFGWQDKYSHANGKTVCDIGIISPAGEWIWKADGAGDSDIEAEKGALSDAFKRAAVRWGIGRYLYDVASPWVPCETYTNASGKTVWKSWSEDPWKYVKKSLVTPVSAPPKLTTAELKDIASRINVDVETAWTWEDLDRIFNLYKPSIEKMPKNWADAQKKKFDDKGAVLTAKGITKQPIGVAA